MKNISLSVALLVGCSLPTSSYTLENSTKVALGIVALVAGKLTYDYAYNTPASSNPSHNPVVIEEKQTNPPSQQPKDEPKKLDLANTADSKQTPPRLGQAWPKQDSEVRFSDAVKPAPKHYHPNNTETQSPQASTLNNTQNNATHTSPHIPKPDNTQVKQNPTQQKQPASTPTSGTPDISAILDTVRRSLRENQTKKFLDNPFDNPIVD